MVMTGEERTEEIQRLLNGVVAEMTTRGLLQDEAAAWRAIIVTGLHNLPDHLTKAELRDNLQRFRHWLSHDLAELGDAAPTD